MAISRTTMAIGFSPPPDFMSVPTFLPTLFLGLAGSTCKKKRGKRRRKNHLHSLEVAVSVLRTHQIIRFPHETIQMIFIVFRSERISAFSEHTSKFPIRYFFMVFLASFECPMSSYISSASLPI